eukprot:GHVL01020791.1.p1 GENE.GHVL01020791.1~~GHVL01020791.1.p1  ORF type:complete len:206 (-),score=28.83 GHVL01020791.1:96-713(-)
MQVFSKKKIQKLYFSATIPTSIQDMLTKLTFDLSEKYEYFDATEGKGVTVSQINETYVFIPKIMRVPSLVEVLCDLIGKHPWEDDIKSTGLRQIIIFTSTCSFCQLITTTLERLKFSVTSLHSLLDQKRRIACLEKFKSEASQILVATDVASRGLDIPKVDAVINVSVPRYRENYVHRIGRTARAGRQGLSITLVTPREVHRVSF